MKAARDVRREFDAIARASTARSDGPGLYDRFLLALVPPAATQALEIGCGLGRFSRMLATRVSRVTAIDLSTEMLTVARARAGSATIEYLAGDALAIIPALGRFDVVVSVAMFHHLPLESIQVFKDAVAPGGTLILHDLWRVNSMADRALDAIRLPLKLTRLLRVGAPLTHTAAERAAWREHERDDLHLTKGDVRALRDRFFPGAVLHEHFLWRYTLVWQNKPRIGPPN